MLGNEHKSQYIYKQKQILEIEIENLYEKKQKCETKTKSGNKGTNETKGNKIVEFRLINFNWTIIPTSNSSTKKSNTFPGINRTEKRRTDCEVWKQ